MVLATGNVKRQRLDQENIETIRTRIKKETGRMIKIQAKQGLPKEAARAAVLKLCTVIPLWGWGEVKPFFHGTPTK